ncbi:37S ribosomal protein S24, mitochondrial [Sphaceloma murrayae]|uniref:37S ribosomal protein S24, mitochondrial n=1 Tax=Sphaceloma murrayae TaxID=2082308 RepID=A0A2K1QJU0_9PEZI|nr:37S ribosomal protein S24, mitochondrial [Sphaceloma murrayae]
MPRFGLLNPHDQDPERAQLVQAYMILRSQQTSVQRRLSSPSPESPPPSSASSASSSPETSPLRLDGDELPSTPARRRPSGSSPSASPRLRSQRSPYLRRPSIPSIPEQPESEHRSETDEDKLSSINMKIKATLTDLLNCESVKHDERMRDWVQTRLMDAQHTITDQRRHSTNASHQRANSLSAHGWNYSNPFPHSVRVDQIMQGEKVRKLSI